MFTLTTGRSGTAFLTALLQDNLVDADCHHEFSDWDSFGLDTPAVAELMVFNSSGNTPRIQGFWRQKLARAASVRAAIYVETAHQLMKAGLLENLGTNLPGRDIHMVALERDPIDTVISFRARQDFVAEENRWMWYLDPDYPKKLVPFQAFADMGIDGIRLWYVMEIRARSYYYEMLLQSQINVKFHHVALDELRQPRGAARLLGEMGLPTAHPEIRIPRPQNVTVGDSPIREEQRDEINRLLERAACDPRAHAIAAIERGFRF